jgi:leucyl aminopeptidase
MGGVYMTRDLVNTPAIELYPQRFSELVEALAQEHGLHYAVWRGAELLHQQRCGLIHAVGMGSARPPCLVRLEYGTAREGRPTIALVGKGVTFDSGGLNLKAADGMLLMKKDMAGAATVLGAVQALATFGVDAHVRAYLPMAENMTGESAFRPGDVITSRSGLTVEIGNTDAEGRLLLADALHMAVEDGADWVIDIATLTGACRVALGKKVMGLFSNHDELAGCLQQAARETDEDIWRLPLVSDYAAMLDSPVADVNNAGKDRFGGAITAALFLEKFVGDARWAHLDFYGWSDSAEPGFPVGASGLGVRLLVRAVELLVGVAGERRGA